MGRALFPIFAILLVTSAGFDAAALVPEFSQSLNSTIGILVTDQELRSLSQELFNLDTNNAARFLSIAPQGRGTGCNPDLAPNRLFNVNAAAYQLPTISRMLPLLDNFVADVNVAETLTAAQAREQNEFIDAIFNTNVMRRAETFLQQRGLPNGRAAFVQHWFDFYSRGTGALGSNGFEHVFMVETRGSDIMGGHGWIYFDDQERRGLLDYRGHRNIISNIGGRGPGIATTFTWRNMCKPISSLFTGTSPEFELALFNVCFHARRNALCPVSLGGTLLQIQTFDITRSGRTFVATAFPQIN